MTNITIYDRIKNLCAKKGVTIRKLEMDLNFGNGAVRKWGSSISPSSDKIKMVAEYFGVSTDYILGVSSFEMKADDVLTDEDIIAFQRAKKLSPGRFKIALEIVQAGFDAAFSENAGDDPE